MSGHDGAPGSGGSSRSTEVLIEGLSFGEAPRWRQGRLWFSDFYRREVVSIDEQGLRLSTLSLPDQPSGLGWTPNGDLWIVSMLEHRVLRWDGEDVHPVADLSDLVTGPCNDMVVDDTTGVAYVGNFGFDRHRGEPQRETVLVRVDPDGRTSVAADGLLFPNGMVITPDGATLVVAETFRHQLTAFDRAPDGSLSARRPWALLGDVLPDGICLDAEGAIWVADAGASHVLRVAEGGELLDRVTLDEDRKSFACMLGGAAGNRLFIVTNLASGPPAAATREGRIEYVDVSAPGVGLP